MEPQLALSALAFALAVVSFLATYYFNFRNTRASRRPVLVFVYDHDTGWTLRNVGGGPALNVLVAQKRPHASWFNPVRVPPLAKDGQIALKWLGHVNTTGLGATYTDFLGVPYTATCGNDLSTVQPGVRFGPWQEDEIGRHWSQAPYSE